MAIFYLDSGSFGNVTVTNITATTSSILYVTSSELNVSTNRITVNTGTPAVRFGGLAVIDSGSSPQRSGSILFDSTNNQWIFVHQNTGGAVTSSVFIQGPQTFNNVGNETVLTTNKVPKAIGGDLGEHIGDSNIIDDGTTIQLGSAVQVTGSLLVSSSMTIGSSSIGPSENTLTLGARDAVSEGGQIGFNAPGGTYTSASMIDLYQNRLRILRGTNTGSDAEVASWNMHSKQMALPAYTSATAFTGTTAVSVLGADVGGNIVTTLTSQPSLAVYSRLGSTTKAESPFYTSTNVNGTAAPTNYQFNIQATHIPVSMTITGVRWYQGTAGVYTSTGGTSVALYTYSGGTITLVASSSNQSIFSSSYGSSNAFRTGAFTSTYNATPGTYYIGFCWNPTGTTTPPSLGVSTQIGVAAGSTYDYTNSAAVAMVRNSLGTCPTSQALNGMSGAIQTLYYLALY